MALQTASKRVAVTPDTQSRIRKEAKVRGVTADILINMALNALGETEFMRVVRARQYAQRGKE